MYFGNDFPSQSVYQTCSFGGMKHSFNKIILSACKVIFCLDPFTFSCLLSLSTDKYRRGMQPLLAVTLSVQVACLFHIYLFISLRKLINPSAWHNPSNETVPSVTVAHQQKPACHLFFQRLNKIIFLSSKTYAQCSQNSPLFWVF